MKHLHLIPVALAVLAAQAQAQSAVTVYGVLDLGFAKISNQALVQRENHASRLGFRGSEALGNGVTAVFNLESEILADTGMAKGVLFERQANVGVKGAFGTLLLGRSKNIIDASLGRTEPFGADGVIGKIHESMMRVGVLSSRAQNSLTYVSEKLDGFGISAQYQAAEAHGADAGMAALLTYEQGALSAHFGMEDAPQAAPSLADPKAFTAGAGYRHGNWRWTAQLNRGATDVAATGKYTGYIIGLNIAAGRGDAHLVLGRQKQDTAQFSGREKVRQLGVGYDYHLSRRTDLYAYAGREHVARASSLQAGVSHRF